MVSSEPEQEESLLPCSRCSPCRRRADIVPRRARPDTISLDWEEYAWTSYTYDGLDLTLITLAGADHGTGLGLVLVVQGPEPDGAILGPRGDELG